MTVFIMLVILGLAEKVSSCSTTCNDINSRCPPCRRNEVVVNGQCRLFPCSSGSYSMGTACQSCPSECKDCLSHDLCTGCSGNRALHEGRCIWKCPEGHYDTTVYPSEIKVCQKTQLRGASSECEVGNWSEWSPCGTAAPSIRTRFRPVSNKCVGIPPIEYRFCMRMFPSRNWEADSSQQNSVECPVSEWETWEQCDGCRTKFKKRRRSIDSSVPRRKRHICPNLVEKEPCSCFLDNLLNKGRINCEMEEWSDWSDCDALCGDGEQSRTRAPLFGKSRYCKKYKETRKCCAGKCSDHCTQHLLGRWGEWSACSVECGVGTQRRIRGNIFPALTLFCDIELLYEEKECWNKRCPTPCEVSSWTGWSNCNPKDKSRYRSRHITQYPDIRGQSCPELEDSIPCR